MPSRTGVVPTIEEHAKRVFPTPARQAMRQDIRYRSRLSPVTASLK